MWKARQRPQRYGRLNVKLPNRLAIAEIAYCASRTVVYRVFVQVFRFTPLSIDRPAEALEPRQPAEPPRVADADPAGKT